MCSNFKVRQCWYSTLGKAIHALEEISRELYVSHIHHWGAPPHSCSQLVTVIHLHPNPPPPTEPLYIPASCLSHRFRKRPLHADVRNVDGKSFEDPPILFFWLLLTLQNNSPLAAWPTTTYFLYFLPFPASEISINSLLSTADFILFSCVIEPKLSTKWSKISSGRTHGRMQRSSSSINGRWPDAYVPRYIFIRTRSKKKSQMPSLGRSLSWWQGSLDDWSSTTSFLHSASMRMSPLSTTA